MKLRKGSVHLQGNLRLDGHGLAEPRSWKRPADAKHRYGGARPVIAHMNSFVLAERVKICKDKPRRAESYG